jgi:hypothetical protein
MNAINFTAIPHKGMISGAHRPAAPDQSILKYRLTFEHLAYAVCGIGDTAGNA